MDIAQVDTSDSHSVHSDMHMAVSFDQDFAQLVLTTKDRDEDDDDNDESSLLTNDELLGIAFAHPDSADYTHSDHRDSGSPPSLNAVGRDEDALHLTTKASRYSMRRNTAAAAVTTRDVSIRNTWNDMTVVDDNSFRGVEEWSVAAASVLIETTLTDWGGNIDDDDDVEGCYVTWEDESAGESTIDQIRPAGGGFASATTGRVTTLALHGHDRSDDEEDDETDGCGSATGSMNSDYPFDEQSPRPGSYPGSFHLQVRSRTSKPARPPRTPHRVGV
jgi:hypothetical protein